MKKVILLLSIVFCSFLSNAQNTSQLPYWTPMGKRTAAVAGDSISVYHSGKYYKIPYATTYVDSLLSAYIRRDGTSTATTGNINIGASKGLLWGDGSQLYNYDATLGMKLTASGPLEIRTNGNLYTFPSSGGVIALKSDIGSGITAASPLSFNSSTGVISLPASNGSTDGYLRGTDWAIFNGKQTSFTSQSANLVYRSGNSGGVPSFTALSSSDLPAFAGYGAGTKLKTTRSSSTSLTLDQTATTWVYTGTSDATWALPSLSSYTDGFYKIVNASSYNVMITCAGTDLLFQETAVPTIVLNAGETRTFSFDGTNIQVPVDVKRGCLTPILTKSIYKLWTASVSYKVIWIGDSTSDFTSNASQIPTIVNTAYNQAGDPLSGLNTSTNMPNFGQGGMTLSAWIGGPTGANGLNNVIAANPNIIIFSFGINDARQNLVTKDQLKLLLIRAINSIRTALPNADIVLRMPNSFKIPSTNTYIQQGSYSSLAVAAQAQTDIMYYAYKELENYWPNVVLLNTQDNIFGRVCQTTSTLMTDEIHPQYGPIVKAVVNLIAPIKPFSKDLSADAINSSFAAPYSYYPRAMENADYYDLIASARYNAQGANYIDITCDNAPILSGLIRRGDIINFGDLFFINTNTTVFTALTVQDATHLRIIFAGSVPSNTITGGTVKIFRSKYYNDINTMPYIDNRVVYKYIRTCNISGGSGYIDISTSDQSLIHGFLGRYGSSIVPASKWQLLTTNVFIVAGLAPIVLTGASFITLNETTLRINIAGSYGSYAGNAIIAGTQNYEDPFSIKTACALLYGNPAFTASDVYGRIGVSGSGLYFKGGNGKASVPGVVYFDNSDPSGNTITNTTAKTYFASSFPFVENTINPGQGIDVECSFALTTIAVPGNIIITVELGGNTIVLTIPSTALPASSSNSLVKLRASIFPKGYTAGYSALGGNAILEGAISTSVIRSTDVPALSGQGVNLTIANNLRISTQFSIADVGNIIVMKSMKISTHNN